MAITTVVLDPSAIDPNRAALDLNSAGILVAEGGIDWGDSDIQAYMTDLAIGSAPIDFRIPNRVVQIPLLLGALDKTQYDSARAALQQKVALLQRSGGSIQRGSAPLYADIVKATLTMPDKYTHLDLGADVVLTLECLPDFYGPETTLSAHSELTAPVLTFTEAAVAGDYPGRVRVLIDNLEAGTDGLSAIWGWRCKNYSAATTAKPFYEAEAMTPLDAASSVAHAGSSSGNVIKHAGLPVSWTPVLSTTLVSGSAALTHKGTYRVWACVYSATATPQLRFLSDVGDLVAPVTGSPVRVPAIASFCMVDLGEIRLDPSPLGTHRWAGVLQAKADVSGDPVEVDWLYFQPLDENAGRCVGAPTVDVGLSSFSARDDFLQVAGGLTGKTAPVGGNWTTTGSAGDFVVVAGSTNTVQRVTTVDASIPRHAVLGAAATLTAASVDIAYDTLTGFGSQGLVLREVDTSNYFAVTAAGGSLAVFAVVAGSNVFTVSGIPRKVPATGEWVTIQAAIDAGGRYYVWYGPQGGPLTLIASGQHSSLATGGALASGKPGFRDISNATATRSYDNFIAWVPSTIGDPFVFPSKSTELRTDGVYRAAADGSGSYAPLSVVGDMPRVPPSGLEGRTVEFSIHLSRGDLSGIADGAAMDTRATITYRPCWIFLPSNSN